MKADWATRILLAANQIPVLSKTENMKTCFLLPKSFNSRWKKLIQRWKQNISFHTLTGCRNHSMNPEDDSLLRKETKTSCRFCGIYVYLEKRREPQLSRKSLKWKLNSVGNDGFCLHQSSFFYHLLTDFAEKLSAFQQYVTGLHEDHDLLSQMGNTEYVTAGFDLLSNYTNENPAISSS